MSIDAPRARHRQSTVGHNWYSHFERTGLRRPPRCDARRSPGRIPGRPQTLTWVLNGWTRTRSLGGHLGGCRPWPCRWTTSPPSCGTRSMRDACVGSMAIVVKRRERLARAPHPPLQAPFPPRSLRFGTVPIHVGSGVDCFVFSHVPDGRRAVSWAAVPGRPTDTSWTTTSARPSPAASRTAVWCLQVLPGR